MISILSTAFFSIAPFAQQSNGAERNLIEGQGSIIRIGDWGLPEVDYENASRLSLSEPPARLTFPILIAEHKGSEDSGRSNAPLVHLETFRKRSFIGSKAQEAFSHYCAKMIAPLHILRMEAMRITRIDRPRRKKILQVIVRMAMKI